jgi:hypothetical protein
MYQKEENPRLLLKQIAEEVQSGNYPATSAFLDLIRQTGIVNLFFFLKFIAAYSGPYQLLNETLHMDMCNFRQSLSCLSPGSRSAMFVPRGFYKSTIGGHGANTWELLRNPELRIRLVSNVVERAHHYKSISQRTFDSNKFFAELYPDYVPKKNAGRWNENEFVLPNRQRYYSEPSISAGGATGASEGIHVDFLNLDDIEGLEDLDSENKSSMTMFQKKKWFDTNTTALLISRESRIHLNGTFYATDDVHSKILEDAKEFHGYADPEFKVNPNGHWAIYYRSWIENEKTTFPEVMNEKTYADLLSRNAWSAITQYSNKPRDPALSEFYEFETKRFSLFWSTKKKEWYIIKGAMSSEDANWDDEPEESLLRLGSCSTIMTVDPAGTEKGISARTSRTAITVWSMDYEENLYLLWCRAGYYGPVKMFDLIFEGCRRFEGLVKMVGVESAAMQKIIAPLLERERDLRKEYIRPVPIPALGDKEGRIRMNVGRALMQRRVWLCLGEERDFEEERLVFPNNEYRRDVLDASEKAFVALTRPVSPEDEEEEELADEEYQYAVGRNKYTGY